MIPSLSISIDGQLFSTNTFSFPGGELQVAIPGLTFTEARDVHVIAHLQSSDALIQLMLATEVLDRLVAYAFRRLTIPYFPYARQDRAMQDNEAFSLKVACYLINGLAYDRVTVMDPHSDVLPALLNRVRVVSQLDLVRDFVQLTDLVRANKDLVIVSPDAGAAKKAFKIAQHFQRPLAVAGKQRDVATGDILCTTLTDPKSVAGRACLIVDDICDGGRTFVQLAKVLRAAGATSVHLYVTHGIFSNGLGVFEGLIDSVFTTDSFRKSLNLDDGSTIKHYRHSILTTQRD